MGRSTILSRADLDFMLYDWLDVERLTSRTRFGAHSRETFDAALTVSSELAERYFESHNSLGDVQEPRWEDGRVWTPPETALAVKAFWESGLLAAPLDEDHGGSALPNVVHRACFLWFQAANTSTSAYFTLTMAAVNLLLAHGSGDQISSFAAPMIEGRALGTMCLSEPDAGSSLSEVSTHARPVGDGTWRLHGNKMWISGADHELSANIFHLVLARTDAEAPGVKGLSLFVVPKYLPGPNGAPGERNDVVVLGLNHKMGNRGTVNALLGFGTGGFTPVSGEGAVGYLIGEECHGLDYMFHMMNEARIAVGAGAVALGYTGYLHALDYARVRIQGRDLSEPARDAQQVAIVKHPDVRRMLLASKSWVEGGLALVLYCAHLLDERASTDSPETRSDLNLLLELLTPIAKSWPAKWCLAANDNAIQIHGGYGYSREFPVEQFFRDNRLNAIHEGTTGIQAIDLLNRKVRAKDGLALHLLMERIQSTVDASPADTADLARTLSRLTDRVVRTTDALWADGSPRIALANASSYLDVLGHVVVAWLWLDQCNAAASKIGAFYDGKRTAARYFFTFELAAVDAHLDVLDSLDTSLADLDDAVL